MITEFSAALNQVANERGIEAKLVVEAIEAALLAAYKKDYLKRDDNTDEYIAKIDPSTGEAKIFLKDKNVTPAGFGRIAAQTASQVLLSKIRRSEYENVMDEYREKVGTVISAYVFRADPNLTILDLGKVQGVMPPKERPENERYRIGQRVNVLIKEVATGPRGDTEVIVSRSDKNFIKLLFVEEVPEIKSGVVKIEAIARDAGSRTKIAVSSTDKNVDPVGACVGHKGVRVQSVLSEISPEKIDIVPFNKDIKIFIAQSLSPARVTNVTIDAKENRAQVKVPENEQSLAIGKGGQNVRLAHLLTGWKIDIEGVLNLEKVAEKDVVEKETSQEYETPKKRILNVSILNLDKSVEKALRNADVVTLDKLKSLSRKDLMQIEGIGSRTAEKILKSISVH